MKTSNRYTIKTQDVRFACEYIYDNLRNSPVAIVALYGKTQAETQWLRESQLPRLGSVCEKLNARDYARRRQYGESRAAFEARRKTLTQPAATLCDALGA